MSIFRRVSFLGFALAPLVVLAACGGNGGDGDAFELPPPGEYSFDVTGTMEIEFSEPGVSAAPHSLGGAQIVGIIGDIAIQLGEDGSITIADKDGVILVAEEVKGGPLTLTQNEDKPSTGTISEDGVDIKLNVVAELPDTDETVTTSAEEEIRLESDGNPFSEEGATLTPVDAKPVRFKPVEGYGALNAFVLDMILRERLRPSESEFEVDDDGEFDLFEDTVTPTPTPGTDEPVLELKDLQSDATDCATGEAVVDPAVDIDGVKLKKVGAGIEVEVVPVQAAETSLEDFSFSIIVTLADFFAVTENHAGLLQEGLIDSAGSIIPGSEGHVTWTDGGVAFSIPDGDSIPKGSPLEVAAFHTGVEGGNVNCDTFMAEYTCFGRCDD